MKKYHGIRCSYELTVDESKKVFHAQASGFFAPEDGASFLNDYDEITRSLPANVYTLIIDAPDLKPSSPEVAAALGILLQKYMDVPFMKRYLITKGNLITIMQFKRLGSQIPGWTESVQYVDEVEDIEL